MPGYDSPEQCKRYELRVVHVEEVRLYLAKILPDAKVSQDDASESAPLRGESVDVDTILRLVNLGYRAEVHLETVVTEGCALLVEYSVVGSGMDAAGVEDPFLGHRGLPSLSAILV